MRARGSVLERETHCLRCGQPAFAYLKIEGMVGETLLKVMRGSRRHGYLSHVHDRAGRLPQVPAWLGRPSAVRLWSAAMCTEAGMKETKVTCDWCGDVVLEGLSVLQARHGQLSAQYDESIDLCSSCGIGSTIGSQWASERRICARNGGD